MGKHEEAIETLKLEDNNIYKVIYILKRLLNTVKDFSKVGNA